MNNYKETTKKRGFTLIELLVVVLIIGILSAIALPQYTRAVKKSRVAGVISKLKTIMEAGQVYALANSLDGGTGVTTVDLSYLDVSLPSQTEDLSGFTCQYAFKVLPSSANAKYVATCSGTVTARGINQLENPIRIARNIVNEADYAIASAVNKALSVKHTFDHLYALATLRMDWADLRLWGASWFESPNQGGGNTGGGNTGGGSTGGGSTGGGSSYTMTVGLTNQGDIFCAGSTCRDYGFARVSGLSSSADLGGVVSGTLYTM